MSYKIQPHRLFGGENADTIAATVTARSDAARGSTW